MEGNLLQKVKKMAHRFPQKDQYLTRRMKSVGLKIHLVSFLFPPPFAYSCQRRYYRYTLHHDLAFKKIPGI